MWIGANSGAGSRGQEEQEKRGPKDATELLRPARQEPHLLLGLLHKPVNKLVLTVSATHHESGGRDLKQPDGFLASVTLLGI